MIKSYGKIVIDTGRTGKEFPVEKIILLGTDDLSGIITWTLSADEIDELTKEYLRENCEAEWKLINGTGRGDMWQMLLEVCRSTPQMRMDAFGMSDIEDIIINLRPSHFMQKLYDYKEQLTELKPGDELIETGTKKKYVVLNAQSTHINCIDPVKGAYYALRYGQYRKTGRNFPEVSELIRKAEEG